MKEMPSEKIRAQITLSAYIKKKFPDMKMSGRRGHFRCSCPIHGGSNATAFSIDDEKGYWKCFGGCGSGSIIDLWLALHNKPQSEVTLAMESLAQESGLSISLSDSNSSTLTRSKLSKVVESVCIAAHERLMARDGASAREAHEYLTARGLSDDDIADWKIGIFPAKKETIGFLSAAAKKVVGSQSKEALEKTQLVERSQFEDARLYSQFSDRIIFPIRDDSGSYLGVSARILPSLEKEKKKDGKKKSKYINSRSSELFDKSTVLYGMHNAQLYGKSKTSSVFVCEGQMDVISLSWILNDDEIATATCGTALTEQHMQWLSKFKNVYLLFDNDDAGRRAILKALPIVNYCSSKNVRCITLTSGKDANEIACRDEDALIDDVEANQIPFFDEVARVMWNQADQTPSALHQLARDELETIKRSVDRQRLLDALEQATGLPAEDISREVTMSALPKRHKSSHFDNEHVSPQLVAFAAWLSKMDTSTRKSLLTDLDIWLDSDFVRETLLSAETETDCAVLTYLSIGRDMLDEYKRDDVDHAEQLVAQLAHSTNDSPRSHLIRIARLLLNEVRAKTLDRGHVPFLQSVVMSTAHGSDEVVFAQLSELFDEIR